MKRLLIVLLCVAVLTGCTILKPSDHMLDGDGMEKSYQSVTGKQAMKMMQSGDEYVILDVRARAEYDSEHIPGAVSLPDDEIGDGEIDLLPDRSLQIYVYGRTGEQAKQAAQKLLEKGYNRIIEFGSISDWPGHVVVEEYQAMRPKLILDGGEPGTAGGRTVQVTGYYDNTLTVKFSNESGDLWFYTETFSLSVSDGGQWRALPWPEDKVWEDSELDLPDGESTEIRFDLTGLGDLESGEFLLKTNGIETTFWLVWTE